MQDRVFYRVEYESNVVRVDRHSEVMEEWSAAVTSLGFEPNV